MYPYIRDIIISQYARPTKSLHDNNIIIISRARGIFHKHLGSTEKTPKFHARSYDIFINTSRGSYLHVAMAFRAYNRSTREIVNKLIPTIP